MNAKVSVIIPFYNCPYIDQALQSALSQSQAPYEIIVVNDGSTLHSDRIAPYLSHPHIHYLGKANGGTASALNHGILNATGDYVAWLSSDDVFYHDKIRNQALFMEHNRLLISCTNFNYINAASQLVQLNAGAVFDNHLDYLRCFLQGNPVNGCTVMIKNELFGAIGLFNESLPFTHDYDLWLRAVLNGYPPVMLNQALTGYRRHEGMGTIRHHRQIMAEVSATKERYSAPLRRLIASLGG
ncbi:glycosyltransferase involved in cell wall biosynthesis [Paenibacillus forsythiae]|uniref:Glycosyltransferase involved in cell wall biosynthesis n=1 Tax=Paenibacillus forsythiae TaxID=365616 RepID=A0ABU3HC83_9BACL|nr:glycosyltransferase [Paenibacillus forsythiae]MDT3428345.1 glycosyltransferase involved in cell wall biosynthesis [Paenibacillus forsythiae]